MRPLRNMSRRSRFLCEPLERVNVCQQDTQHIVFAVRTFITQLQRCNLHGNASMDQLLPVGLALLKKGPCVLCSTELWNDR